jgi:hypothetical protein
MERGYLYFAAAAENRRLNLAHSKITVTEVKTY